MPKENICLEEERIRITFDGEYGRIVSLYNKLTGLEMIQEVRLAENFRLLIPEKGVKNNYILGREQKLTEVDKRDGQVTLLWSNLESPYATYPIDVRMSVGIPDDEGFALKGSSPKGEVAISVSISNHSQAIIEEVWYPILGGLTGVGQREKTKEFGIISSEGNAMESQVLFKNFVPMTDVFPCPYFRYRYPYRLCKYPSWNMPMQWIDFYNEAEGFYIGSHDETCETKWFFFELRPCLGSHASTDWPIPEEVGNRLIGLIFSVVRLPYIDGGENWTSSPVVYRFHCGDWHSGAERYRRWAATWLKFPPKPPWVRDCHSWMTTNFQFPDNSVSYRFTDIPKLARTCEKYSVDALQLLGFHRGGMDRNYPDFSPDPRLGSPEELRDGIKKAQEMSVRIILLSKIHRADSTTKWYREELHKYAVKNKDGVEALFTGYGFNTFAEAFAEMCPRLARMCPASAGWKEVVLEQVNNMVALGADGTQLDEIHDAGFLCFDRSHNHSPIYAGSGGMLNLVKALKVKARAANEDFSLAGEVLWDGLFQYLDVSYKRNHNIKGVLPALKFTFPETLETVCIDESDFVLVNYAVMTGRIMNFEIFNYRATLSEAEEIAEYAAEVIRLRKMLSKHIWYAAFQDTLGAQVVGETEGIMYGVFKDSGGKLSVVVINNSRQDKNIRIMLDTEQHEGTIYRPFAPAQDVSLNNELTVNKRGLVIFVQK